MLTSLLAKGLKMETDDVALVRLEPEQACTLQTLQGQLSLQRLVLWGIRPDELGLKVASHRYTCLHYGNIQLLAAGTFEEVAASTEQKKMLWTALQQLFSNA